MELQPNSLNGMYARWALAWVPNPKDVIKKVMTALKPGSKLVFHEYITGQLIAFFQHPSNSVLLCVESFKNSDSEIDVGATFLNIYYCWARRFKAQD